MGKYLYIIISILVFSSVCLGLEPGQILIIANSDCAESLEIAEFYCAKRQVPEDNIFTLALGSVEDDQISRSDYDSKLAGPIREKLSSGELRGKIRCLLTVYGVPVMVGQAEPLKGQERLLSILKKELAEHKEKTAKAKDSGDKRNAKEKKADQLKKAKLESEIGRIRGKETNASVDSELSMVLFDEYDLYRWQENRLKWKLPYWDYKSLMVCRLDGPGVEIIKGLVDKSLAAEKDGLKGKVYIDSGYGQGKNPAYGKFDEYLAQAARNIREKGMEVVEEKSGKLFAAGECPKTALYCGWYSLKKYVDAFDFVDGAIGYHIASWEAIGIRDANSRAWCPSMLADGITATLGPVAEPYLHSFPKPNEFFGELFEGRCLVEAFYRSKPFNSWQQILIGDPLYRPFGKSKVWDF